MLSHASSDMEFGKISRIWVELCKTTDISTQLPLLSSSLSASALSSNRDRETRELLQRVDALICSKESNWLNEKAALIGQVEQTKQEMLIQKATVQQKCREIRQLKDSMEDMDRKNKEAVRVYEQQLTSVQDQGASLRMEYERLQRRYRKQFRSGGEELKPSSTGVRTESCRVDNTEVLQLLSFVKESRQRCEQLETERENLLLQCESIKCEKHTVSEKYERESSQLQSKLSASRSQIGSCLSELKSSKCLLVNSQSELDSCKSQLDSCLSELNNYKSQLSCCQSELDTCKSEVNTYESRLSSCQSELSMCKSHLSNLKSQLQDKCDELKELERDKRNQYADLQSQLSSNDHTINRQKSHVARLKKLVDDVLQSQRKILQEKEELDGHCRKLLQEKQELESHFRKSSQALRKAEEERSSTAAVESDLSEQLKQQLHSCTVELQQLREHVKQLEPQLLQQNTKIGCCRDSVGGVEGYQGGCCRGAVEGAEEEGDGVKHQLTNQNLLHVMKVQSGNQRLSCNSSRHDSRTVKDSLAVKHCDAVKHGGTGVSNNYTCSSVCSAASAVMSSHCVRAGSKLFQQSDIISEQCCDSSEYENVSHCDNPNCSDVGQINNNCSNGSTVSNPVHSPTGKNCNVCNCRSRDDNELRESSVGSSTAERKYRLTRTIKQCPKNQHHHISRKSSTEIDELLRGRTVNKGETFRSTAAAEAEEDDMNEEYTMVSANGTSENHYSSDSELQSVDAAAAEFQYMQRDQFEQLQGIMDEHLRQLRTATDLVLSKYATSTSSHLQEIT